MESERTASRRRVLGRLSVAGAVLLAGCGSVGEEPDGATDDDPNEEEGEDAEGEADDDGDDDAMAPPEGRL